MSNDYKSMLGFWNKLSEEEKKKFVLENVKREYFGSGLVYCGVSKAKKNKPKSNNDSLDKLKREIEKAIRERELPAIDFNK